MNNAVKALSILNGKKRYIAAAIIGIELLSLPAAAHIIHRVSFDAKPHVVAVEVPTAEQGLSRFLVTSNDAFSVTTKNLVGEVQIAVRKSGSISGGQRFGDAAQLPGDQVFCADSTAPRKTHIYAATRGTAGEDGKVVDQAVIFEFRYEEKAKPSFAFTAKDDMADIPTPCPVEMG